MICLSGDGRDRNLTANLKCMCKKKASGEYIQSGKQYEEAQDSIKEEKPFVATSMEPTKNAGVPDGFQKMVQQFSGLHN